MWHSRDGILILSEALGGSKMLLLRTELPDLARRSTEFPAVSNVNITTFAFVH